MPRYVLAVDAGQTGVRLRLQDGPRPPATPVDPRHLSEYPGVRTAEPLAPQLARLARSAVADAQVDWADVVLGIGTSGVADAPALAAALRAELGDAGTGPARLLVTHDSVSSYLGALGEEHGVVVAAGTGAIILGVGATATARVDGWGYLMGDDGSGFSLGARGWRAVMRDHDGRGPHTALTADFRRDYPDLESAYVRIQADPDRIRLVASYARRVTALAPHDDVAAGLARWAGAELAASVVTAARRVGLDGEVPVARLGRVLTDPTVDAAFRADLLAALPQARLVEPAGTGLDGAGLLGGVAAGSALAADIAGA